MTIIIFFREPRIPNIERIDDVNNVQFSLVDEIEISYGEFGKQVVFLLETIAYLQLVP